MKEIDWTPFPPAVVAWSYSAIDSICEPLGCRDWRELLPLHWTQKGAWLSGEFKLERSLSDFLPSLISYEQYLQQLQQQQQQQQLQNTTNIRGWETLYKFAFETSSTVLADLTSPSAIIVLSVLVLFLRQIKAFLLPKFSSIGRTAAISTHGSRWLESRNNQIRIVKFGEYVFRLLFHTAISIVGVIYFWDKEWWKSDGTNELWVNWPNQAVEPGMAWYYILQSAYNLEALISLLELSFVLKVDPLGKTWRFPGIRVEWSPNVRGDFREMLVHHLITNCLIIGSSYYRFTRVGSMVFLIHDISDVPVDLSKLANFLKWKISTAVCFATMVVMWCITRLCVLPFVIFRSVLNESFSVCTAGSLDPLIYVFYKPFFVFGVAVLIILHLAWFTMFIQMGWFLIFKGEAHDLSEHKAGESQHEAAPLSAPPCSLSEGKRKRN